jgi:site-specific DNA-methyltransferase (adenine-specific)
MGGITYPTMSTTEICNLSIPSLTDTNCALFLWVTMPMLPDGLAVIKAWNFEYVTCAFTWVKQNKNSMGIYSGLGHWTNGNAELCLLARKGRLTRINKDVKQIMLSPVSDHSRKPSEARDRIIKLLGDLPRIELFARQKVDGWDCWGNEVESDIKLEVPRE